MITGAQIHAARALLGWSVQELAHRSIVSIATVNLFEEGHGMPSTSVGHLNAIQATLETAGIEFLSGDAPGVKLKAKGKRQR
jgi:transcriptional regulator with XRE-family HTH domain